MKLIDLTMPVWPGAGYGEILPFTNTPVDFVEYMDYAKNGLRQTRMKLNGETGSPLMVPAQHAPFADFYRIRLTVGKEGEHMGEIRTIRS